MLNEVIEILREALNLGENIEVTECTSSDSLPEWDSFGQIVLFQKLEQHFDLKFSFDEMISMESVGDICQVIENKQHQNK
ncbi:MAG: acyl carrier protein [Lachnospiraceae bacterium]|nr:acyl carrier protein [Lachnospiraceae bacterium]